jgi:hypothetical protein
MKKTVAVKYGNEQRHYDLVGNRKDVIAEWEDGFRTDGVKNAFEWWYFDAHLNDGSSLVILFYSKTVFDAQGPLKPQVSFTLNTSDGKKIDKTFSVPVQQFSASKKTCDVRIGSCSFVGNLKDYTIHFENDDIIADIKLTGKIKSWRQGNAFNYFGNQEEKNFAWLPAVPDGTVEADITVGGVRKLYTGTGYHDHNWGNVNMASIMHHWYWGRAKAGKYNFITAYVFSEKAYGYTPLSTFLLAENNEIVVGNDDAYKFLTFTTHDEYIDYDTKKPVSNIVVFDYNDGQKHYRITYKRKRDIAKHKMIDTLKGVTKILASLVGFDGAYIRFAGEVTVDKYIDGNLAESVTEVSAVWELMYFGKSVLNS